MMIITKYSLKVLKITKKQKVERWICFLLKQGEMDGFGFY